MKKALKLISTILAAVMGISVFAGCSDKGDSGDNPVYVPDEKPVIPTSDVVFVKDGASEYKVVMPESVKTKEAVARDELVTFIQKSTGAELAVINDSGLSFNPDDKYISVGDTNILATSGVAVTREELTLDGYKVVKKGNTVIIAGPSEFGTLYGVYAFLEHEIGFRVYAEDEIKYDTANELLLKEFDLKDVPDFERRQLGYYTVSQDNEYLDRMRANRHGHDWIYGSHSHFTIMPPNTYKLAHPDWYSKDGTQLCLTNEEMRKQFVANLKSVISSHPDSHYILLGEEDSNTFCDCENCKKAIEKYGTESGVDMVFVNKVARDIKAWLAETDPDRTMYIGTFAYLKTIPAPVKEDENGELVPTHPDVVAEDNVFIYFAPLHANYSYGFMDATQNAETADSFTGWQVVCPMFCVWTYSANFYNYFTNFNNWGTQALQYTELKSAGVKVIYDMGTWDTAAPSFERLRTYLTARLMWDTELDTQELIADFMQNYYKGAAEYMTEYYNLMRTYLELIRVENNMDATCYVNYNQQRFWSKAYLDTCLKYFRKAEAAVEPIKTDDPSMYEKLINRIRMEKLTVLFFTLQFYQQSYTPSEQNAMIDEFESVAKLNNVMYWHEHTNLSQGDDGSVSIRIAAWRLAVNN